MAILDRSISNGESHGRRREGRSEVWRSFSSAEVATEISPVEDRSPPASSSHSQLRAGARGRRQRVSFSLVEDHIGLEQRPRQDRLRELTSVTHSKILATAKNNVDHMPYNYEQPGFVERGKDGARGTAYTIYSVNSLKDCSKRPCNPVSQSPLIRAFSLTEKRCRSSKIVRSCSLSIGRSAVPLECMACGNGYPGAKDLGFCKSCESTALRSELGESKYADSKKDVKNKSILDYCRKLLELFKSGR